MPAETHVEQAPLSREEVFALVQDRISEILEIDPQQVTLSSSFVQELDADSVALLELVEVLEEELGERTVGFSIDDEDLIDLLTIEDAVNYVMFRMQNDD